MIAMIAAAIAAAAPGPQVEPPAIFAPGQISAVVTGTAPTFMPDGNTVIYERDQGPRRDLVEAHRTATGWSPPTALPFPAQWSYLEPALAPDGSYLIFASNRPPEGGDRPLDGHWNDKTWPGRGGALWRAERTATGWSQPKPLPAAINAGGSVFEPAITGDGSLYFMRPHGTGRFELLRAQAKAGGYGEPQPLPFWREGVADVDPAAPRDDSYLIFSSGRAGAGKLDLYVAFRRAGGGWGEPIAFPAAINEGRSPTDTQISADEQTLYFSSGMVIWSTPLQPVLAQLRRKA